MTEIEINTLSKQDFVARVQELATGFVERYTESRPLFPWRFVVRPDSRSFDSHVHLAVFQAYEDSSNDYDHISEPLNGFDEIRWYADIDTDDESLGRLFAKYQKLMK